MESKLKRNVRNFFSKRNGIDDLAVVCFVIGLIPIIVGIFFPQIYYLFIIGGLFVLYSLFRIFSRNIYFRERENMAFCNLFKKKNKVRRQRPIKAKKEKKVKQPKVKKDKNFIYKNCPHCNNELKISKGKKGEIIIMCGKCYNEIKFNVK